MANEFMFGIYQEYYNLGLFDKEYLDLVVSVGDLSAEQEAKILGTSTSATKGTDQAANTVVNPV